MTARRVVSAALAMALVLGLLYVGYGRLHVDESYYLYASRLVYQGKLLYRDFFFLQNPGLPYVYGLPLLVWPSPYAGRLLSLAFSLLAVMACAGTARRLAGESAAALAAVLLASASFHAYFVSIVRVYAATTSLLMVAAFFYVRLRSPIVAAGAAGAAIGAAIDFRLTAAPALAALVAVLLWRRQGTAALAAAGGGAAVIGAAFLPFALAAPDKLWFQLVGFHAEIRVAGGLKELLAFKLKAAPRLANAYFLFWACMLLLVTLLWQRHGRGALTLAVRALRAPEHREADLWVVGVALFVAHLAPNFVQASYFVVAMPILMAVVAASLARCLPPIAGPAAWLVLGLGALQVLAYGKSSLDPDGRLRGPFARLGPQVDYLRSVTKPGDLVLTSDSQLVPFLAGREILHGFESFEYFPAWSTEKCRAYGVVNDAMLKEHLATGSAAAVLINDLSYMKPFPVSVDTGPEPRDRILEVLKSHYELGAEFPNPYIPGGVTSQVWLRRTR